MGADSQRSRVDLRPTGGSGLGVVAASIALSVLARDLLGETVRIHWSVGTYYGPEFVPAAAVLGAFPVAIALSYLGFRTLAGRLEADDRDIGEHYAVELAALATLVVALGLQSVLVVANLL